MMLRGLMNVVVCAVAQEPLASGSVLTSWEIAPSHPHTRPLPHVTRLKPFVNSNSTALLSKIAV